MTLIPIPATPPKPAAQLIAEELLAGLNAEMSRRVEHHSREFSKFWNSPVTPDELLEQMGDLAPIMLAASRENLRNLGTLAAMAGMTLDDVISPSNYEPRREFVKVEGKLVLAPPADGYDAWGRLIPIPPEPEPEDTTLTTAEA